MKAVFILAVILLVLLLLGQVRVGGRAEFNAEGFFLWIRLGRLQIKLLPGKPKEDKPPKKPRKPSSPNLGLSRRVRLEVLTCFFWAMMTRMNRQTR